MELQLLILENQSDSEIAPSLSNRIINNFHVASWSFDKGFWHKDNKSLFLHFVILNMVSKRIAKPFGSLSTITKEKATKRKENQLHTYILFIIIVNNRNAD